MKKQFLYADVGVRKRGARAKVLAILISCAMIVSMIPSMAFAASPAEDVVISGVKDFDLQVDQPEVFELTAGTVPYLSINNVMPSFEIKDADGLPADSKFEVKVYDPSDSPVLFDTWRGNGFTLEQGKVMKLAIKALATADVGTYKYSFTLKVAGGAEIFNSGEKTITVSNVAIDGIGPFTVGVGQSKDITLTTTEVPNDPFFAKAILDITDASGQPADSKFEVKVYDPSDNLVSFEEWATNFWLANNADLKLKIKAKAATDVGEYKYAFTLKNDTDTMIFQSEAQTITVSKVAIDGIADFTVGVSQSKDITLKTTNVPNGPFFAKAILDITDASGQPADSKFEVKVYDPSDNLVSFEEWATNFWLANNADLKLKIKAKDTTDVGAYKYSFTLKDADDVEIFKSGEKTITVSKVAIDGVADFTVGVSQSKVIELTATTVPNGPLDNVMPSFGIYEDDGTTPADSKFEVFVYDPGDNPVPFDTWKGQGFELKQDAKMKLAVKALDTTDVGAYKYAFTLKDSDDVEIFTSEAKTITVVKVNPSVKTPGTTPEVWIYKGNALPDEAPGDYYNEAGTYAWDSSAAAEAGNQPVVFTPTNDTIYADATFDVAVKVLDKTALDTYITQAEGILEGAKRIEGSGVGQVTTSVIKALEDAILAAKAVAAKAAHDNTQTAIDTALDTLKEVATKAWDVNPPAKQELVKVKVPDVQKIRASLKTIYIKANDKRAYTLHYVLDTVGGKAIKDSGLKVTSSDSKVARVWYKGTSVKIAGFKKGTATITLKAQNGKTFKVKVVVVSKAVSLKSFSVKAPKSLKKGKTYQMTVSKLTKKATDVYRVKFASSNKKVLTVDSVGKITALKKGTAKITVTAGTKKVVRTITVK